MSGSQLHPPDEEKRSSINALYQAFLLKCLLWHVHDSQDLNRIVLNI